MAKLEVFFDYSCPFCLRGHQYLMELYRDYPEVEIVWCPCEAHPRPEEHGRHSDLTIEGMYYAQEKGIDLFPYHEAMYRAAVTDKGEIESIPVLAEYVKEFVDTAEFTQTLEAGTYRKRREAGNDYAYKENGVWAVPSYRMEGKKLDAIEGVGVTLEQLKDFLDQV